MRPLTDAELRSSLVNVTVRERAQLTPPPDLADRPWDRLDFLGWRDPRIPALGYVVTELDGAPVGVLLKQAERTPRARAQCSWCEDVQLPNPVVFFGVRRAGSAGRNGNTIGTLVCAHFECPQNVRKRPPVAYIGFDVEAARQRRIDVLREHVERFVRDVRDGA
jgi:hypothetical protein